MSDNSESAQYFKLKKFEYSKTSQNDKAIAVKESCFTKYNQTLKKDEYVSNSFGGELYKVTLAKPKTLVSSKTGQDFVAQDVFFEFHSYDKDQNLVREVVTISRNSSLLEGIIASLIFETNFSKIDFKTGSFIPKGKASYIDFITVYSNTVKLPKMIGTESDEYPKPKGAIVLPKKVYNKVLKSSTDPDTGKKVQVEINEIDSNWVFEKDQVFDTAIETVIKNVEKYTAENPKDYTPKTYIEEAVDETPINKTFVNDLPEIDVEEIGTQMPF
jgi:hypothetical protein